MKFSKYKKGVENHEVMLFCVHAEKYSTGESMAHKNMKYLLELQIKHQINDKF